MLSAIKYAVDSLKRNGFPAECVLRGTGLGEAELAALWLPLMPDQYRTVLDNIVGVTGSDDVGLQLGLGLRIADLGPAGFAAMTSPTFAVARRVCVRLQLLLDPVIFASHSLQPRGWQMLLKEVYPLNDCLRFSVDGHIGRTLRVISALTGERNFIREIGLSYPMPRNGADYADHFGCRVLFGQRANWMLFDPDLLQLRLPLANPETHSLLQRECDEQVAQLDVGNSFAKRVAHEILRSRSGGMAVMLGLEEIAERFCVSARTLRRRLAEEGTTYQQIVDGLRKDISLQLLASTRLSAKEIAYSLGYSSVNNFRRAFKTWTGNRISDIRAEAGCAAR